MAITPEVTHEIMFIALVLFFALKYRQAKVRYNVLCFIGGFSSNLL